MPEERIMGQNWAEIKLRYKKVKASVETELNTAP